MGWLVWTTANLIWNRATMQNGGPSPARGDIALSSLLRAHGLIMNGGVLHAVEVMPKGGWKNALAGYRFFCLGSVADLLARAKAEFERGEDLEEFEVQFNAEYSTLVPDDSYLTGVFEHYFEANPSDFAPV